MRPEESSTLPDGQSPQLLLKQTLLQQSLFWVQGKPDWLMQQRPFTQRPLTAGWGGQQSASAVQVVPIDPHIGVVDVEVVLVDVEVVLVDVEVLVVLLVVLLVEVLVEVLVVVGL